jgi:hypothetical protein
LAGVAAWGSVKECSISKLAFIAVWTVVFIYAMIAGWSTRRLIADHDES